MKDEIKEINIKWAGEILDYVDTKEHLFELFKHITNLQDYKSRNEKAIGHLEESINDYLKEDRDLDGTCNVMCYETIKKRYLKPVVGILKGSDSK